MNAPTTASAPVLQALEAAWARSDALFGLLQPEALFAQPIPLRHPFVFYLGHLPAFAVNQVLRGVLEEQGLDAELDELFERGIDPHSAAAAAACTPAAWPDPARIAAYRAEARARVRAAVPRLEACDPDDPLAAGLRVLHLVLEHELMHHETLLYMLAELDAASKTRPTLAPGLVTGPGPDMEIVAIPAGTVTLGAHFDALPFGWDNEFPEHRVSVPRFAIDRYPVTVEQFRSSWTGVVRRRSPVVGRRLGGAAPQAPSLALAAGPRRHRVAPHPARSGSARRRRLAGAGDRRRGSRVLRVDRRAAAQRGGASPGRLRRTPARSPLALGRHPSRARTRQLRPPARQPRAGAASPSRRQRSGSLGPSRERVGVDLHPIPSTAGILAMGTHLPGLLGRLLRRPPPGALRRRVAH